MRLLVIIPGLTLILVILWDAFETIILPRRVTRRIWLTSVFLRLTEFRSMYEPYVCALSEMLLMPLPPWILGSDAIDNWKTSAWGRIQ